MEKACLVIIDGFGLSQNTKGNATLECKFIEKLKQKGVFVELQASGKYVGILDHMPGNSEVGHFTIGAGRIVKQSLLTINDLYYKGDLKKLVLKKKLTKKIHLIGLLSDGGVHSHIDHVDFLLEILQPEHDVVIHAISDGIDSSNHTFNQYFKKYITKIVSITGRYYAMDRDNNWERTNKTFEMMVNGQVVPFDVECKNLKNTNADSCEFLEPTLIKDNRISPEDTVILFNFRADRMRQLYSKFVSYCKTYTMNEYLLNDSNSIIERKTITNTLSEYLSKQGKTQTHIGETEKFAHITYFFNGDKEIRHDNEEWVVVASPKTDFFSKTPGTSMHKVTERAIESMHQKRDVIVLNLAAPDLLSHAGVFKKVQEACGILDEQVKRLYKACITNKYSLVIVADHGNAEEMYKEDHILKSHTTNPVPFIALNTDMILSKRDTYSLQDVAPTILNILNIEKPEEMTGNSLLIKK